MIRREASPSTPERIPDGLESFISDARMKNLILAMLHRTGRIDDTGAILPITVERRLHDPEQWAVGPSIEDTYRTDMLLPSAEAKRYITTNENGQQILNRIPWNTEGKLYDTLTHHEQISLDSEDIQKLRDDKQELEDICDDASSQYELHFEDLGQLSDAYHIKRKEREIAEFANTRIYVSGGVRAMEITSYLIKSGATFDYAKLWIPYSQEGTQKFRDDTPIFEVNTFSQLSSVVAALREASAEGLIKPEETPLVGEPIANLPGVYIGQLAKGKSFNGTMRNLFGQPIETACNEIPLPADHHINDEWLNAVAKKAKQIAYEDATSQGVDNAHHAFLKDQPVQHIIDVANTV